MERGDHAFERGVARVGVLHEALVERDEIGDVRAGGRRVAELVHGAAHPRRRVEARERRERRERAPRVAAREGVAHPLDERHRERHLDGVEERPRRISSVLEGVAPDEHHELAHVGVRGLDEERREDRASVLVPRRPRRELAGQPGHDPLRHLALGQGRERDGQELRPRDAARLEPGEEVRALGAAGRAPGLLEHGVLERGRERGDGEAPVLLRGAGALHREPADVVVAQRQLAGGRRDDDLARGELVQGATAEVGDVAVLDEGAAAGQDARLEEEVGGREPGALAAVGEDALEDRSRDLAAHEIGELDPFGLAELEPRQAEDLVLEARRLLDGAARELADHRRGEALLAARAPAQEVRGAELVGVLEEEGVVVRLEGRLTKDVEEGHGTGTSLVRTHQGVDLRLAHGDLALPGSSGPCRVRRRRARGRSPP